MDGQVQNMPGWGAGQASVLAVQPVVETHRGLEVSLAQLRQVFHLPSEDAAVALGVTHSRVKRACRRLGILRWPQRKLASLSLLQSVVEKDEQMNQDDQRMVMKKIRFEYDALVEDPNHHLDPELEALRLYLWKMKHYVKLKAARKAGLRGPAHASTSASRAAAHTAARDPTRMSSNASAGAPAHNSLPPGASSPFGAAHNHPNEHIHDHNDHNHNRHHNNNHNDNNNDHNNHHNNSNNHNDSNNNNNNNNNNNKGPQGFHGPGSPGRSADPLSHEHSREDGAEGGEGHLRSLQGSGAQQGGRHAASSEDWEGGQGAAAPLAAAGGGDAEWSRDSGGATEEEEEAQPSHKRRRQPAHRRPTCDGQGVAQGDARVEGHSDRGGGGLEEDTVGTHDTHSRHGGMLRQSQDGAGSCNAAAVGGGGGFPGHRRLMQEQEQARQAQQHLTAPHPQYLAQLLSRLVAGGGPAGPTTSAAAPQENTSEQHGRSASPGEGPGSGALTSDGQIATFRTGVEKILARRPVPVVPMALRGLWGSVWSKRDSMLHRARLPRRFRAHVELVIDTALSPESVTALALEKRVGELRGDLA
ncbi:MAG: hypothetical protein WDW38_007768 [Sanguina aurantia]